MRSSAAAFVSPYACSSLSDVLAYAFVIAVAEPTDYASFAAVIVIAVAVVIAARCYRSFYCFWQR